jgi:alpha-tubulin suppressor-like RCC1 family protein
MLSLIKSAASCNVLTRIVSSSINDVSSIALKTYGTLWVAGSSAYGQLGSSNTIDVITFTQVLEGVSKVVINADNTFALKLDGTLWGTGRNFNGELGLGHKNTVITFTQVIDGVSQIVISDGIESIGVSFVIKTDDTLWGCGNNGFGQLGTGNTISITTFTQVLTNVSKVITTGTRSTAGNKSGLSFALLRDDTLQGCGYNSDGQLGLLTFDYYQFTQVTTNVYDVYFEGSYATVYNSLILLKDGRLLECGYDVEPYLLIEYNFRPFVNNDLHIIKIIYAEKSFFAITKTVHC